MGRAQDKTRNTTPGHHTMSTLDTKETLATLHRVNAIAKIRKLAINEILRQAKQAPSLERLQSEIARIEQELFEREQHLIS